MDNVSGFLDREVLLWTWRQVGLAFLLILAGFVARAILNVIIRQRLLKLAERTETEADDMAGEALVNPLGLILPVVGVYLALRCLLSVRPEWLASTDQVFKVVTILVVAWTIFRLLDAVAVLLSELAARTDSRLDDQIVPLVRKATKTFVGRPGVHPHRAEPGLLRLRPAGRSGHRRSGPGHGGQGHPGPISSAP